MTLRIFRMHTIMRRWALFRQELIRIRYSINQVEVGSVEETYLDLLYDPQTSGGLLISVSPKEYENMMRDFRASGLDTTVSVIGTVAPKSDKLIRLF